MKKVVLITGATSGFGKAMSELLKGKEYIVYGTTRKCIDPGNDRMLQMDVTKPETIQKAIQELLAREGRVDVLINNAGMGISGALELTAEAEFELQMQTNFYGCVHMCQAVIPIMRKQKKGLIINFSSIGGVIGLPYQGFYSASKFAVEGFSEALAAEVSGFGIKVTVVEPGDFATGFTSNRKSSLSSEQSEAYAQSYHRSMAIIEKEENEGLKPQFLAKKVEKIIRAKHPKYRYVIANFEQKLSVLLKRTLPSRWFIRIIRSYYDV
jgi:Short-chain dehydrogenases of various substrate specificities